MYKGSFPHEINELSDAFSKSAFIILNDAFKIENKHDQYYILRCALMLTLGRVLGVMKYRKYGAIDDEAMEHMFNVLISERDEAFEKLCEKNKDVVSDAINEAQNSVKRGEC